MNPYEPELYRERICLGWDEVAEDYQVITLPFLEQYLQKLLEVSELNSNMNVLDVGTGTGLAALKAAEKIKPDGRVLAIDFSENMLNITRTIIDSLEITNIDVYRMPAEVLDIESEMFDRVICNFGLSFFSEPQKALAEMHRVLKENGRLTLSTWAKQDRCLVLGLMDKMLKNCVPALKESEVPSIFAFGTKKSLGSVLKDVGFKNIKVVSEIHSARYKQAGDYWEKLYRTGPELRDILSNLKPVQVKKIKKRVLEEVEKYREGDKIILPSEALIATGIK
ncbi:MAG: methyltransferase domain-containing protein [Thermoplasmata archaeon]|nr:MAG: methyltransferase domain-containing protein [Thermoplasmata archaeon]